MLHSLGLAIITYGFSANITHRWFVRSHDGALALQLGFLKQFVEFACLIDTTSHQHGITPPIVQARFCLHIKNNIRYNLSQSGLGAEHLLQIAPALFQLGFCHTGQTARFCLKPSVDPILLDNILLHLTSLITQIQNHFIPHSFIKLIAMDVRAKYLQTGLLIFFHQWSTCETDKSGIRQNGFHRFVELAGLGTVAFIHKDIEISFGRKVFRQQAFQILNKSSIIGLAALAFVFLAKLVNQGAHHDRRGVVDLLNQFASPANTDNALIYPGKHLLNLHIQLVPVGDNQDTAVRNILLNPLAEPHHGQGFSGALGMPDDTALMTPHKIPCCHIAKELIRPTGLFYPTVKHNEIMQQLYKPLFPAQRNQVFVQTQGVFFDLSAYRYGNLIFGIGIFFPGKIILFWCAGGTVTRPLRIIASQDKPNSGKKLHDHIRALVCQVLADTLRHGNCAALQLNDRKSDAVDVQHQIRALVLDGYFLGDVKVIFQRMLPIHKLDCDFMLADRLADLDPIAQLFIGLLVQIVKVHRLISGSIL